MADPRDERRAIAGDEAAALRVFYAKQAEGRQGHNFDARTYDVTVPKIGSLKFMVHSGTFISVGADKDMRFSLFGVPLRLNSVRYQFLPDFPELGWTTLNEEGVKILRDPTRGLRHLTDYYYLKNVWAYRADEFHEEASDAAKERIRKILDPAVNAWAKSSIRQIESGELRQVRENLYRVGAAVAKAREALEALEGEAARLTIGELRLESRGVKEP